MSGAFVQLYNAFADSPFTRKKVGLPQWNPVEHGPLIFRDRFVVPVRHVDERQGSAFLLRVACFAWLRLSTVVLEPFGHLVGGLLAECCAQSGKPEGMSAVLMALGGILGGPDAVLDIGVAGCAA